MDIRDIHILIEQGLQNTGVFVYPNIEHEEIDIHFNRVVEQYISEIVKQLDGKSYQENQDFIDALKIIEVVDFETSNLANVSNYTRTDLPTNYRNRINIKAEINYTCQTNGVSTNVVETVACRFVKRSELDDILEHPFGGTSKTKPVASISGNNVFVYRDNVFTITKIFLDYLRKPIKVVYARDGNGDYDAANSVDCEFSDEVCYDLVDKTVSRLIKLTEQSQQKIVNIENEKIT